MEFCNKGMVRADPLPPSYGQRPYFYIFFFWTLPLGGPVKCNSSSSCSVTYLISLSNNNNFFSFLIFILFLAKGS